MDITPIMLVGYYHKVRMLQTMLVVKSLEKKRNVNVQQQQVLVSHLHSLESSPKTHKAVAHFSLTRTRSLISLCLKATHLAISTKPTKCRRHSQLKKRLELSLAKLKLKPIVLISKLLRKSLCQRPQSMACWETGARVETACSNSHQPRDLHRQTKFWQERNWKSQVPALINQRSSK